MNKTETAKAVESLYFMLVEACKAKTKKDMTDQVGMVMAMMEELKDVLYSEALLASYNESLAAKVVVVENKEEIKVQVNTDHIAVLRAKADELRAQGREKLARQVEDQIAKEMVRKEMKPKPPRRLQNICNNCKQAYSGEVCRNPYCLTAVEVDKTVRVSCPGCHRRFEMLRSVAAGFRCTDCSK